MGSYDDEIQLNVADAVTNLQSARDLLGNGQYQAAASRAAQSAFHTASALLLDEEIETSKHGDVISLIQEVFVNERRLTKEQGAHLSWLFARRNTGGQPESIAGTPEDARRAVEIAESFFNAAKVILEG